MRYIAFAGKFGFALNWSTTFCLVGASAHSKRRIIVIGIMTSLYLSLRYGPRSLFAMDQIKFTSVETSTGESSHIASIICLSAICRLPHFSLSSPRLPLFYNHMCPIIRTLTAGRSSFYNADSKNLCCLMLLKTRF